MFIFTFSLPFCPIFVSMYNILFSSIYPCIYKKKCLHRLTETKTVLFQQVNRRSFWWEGSSMGGPGALHRKTTMSNIKGNLKCSELYKGQGGKKAKKRLFPYWPKCCFQLKLNLIKLTLKIIQSLTQKHLPCAVHVQTL